MVQLTHKPERSTLKRMKNHRFTNNAGQQHEHQGTPLQTDHRICLMRERCGACIDQIK